MPDGTVYSQALRLAEAAVERHRQLLAQKDEAEQDLLAFVRMMWPVMEPETPLVEGWLLDILCLPYEAEIITDAGPVMIGRYVESGATARVLSFNHSSGLPEWKTVNARHKSCGKPLTKITLCDTILSVTDDHPVYVKGRGYIGACEVRSGETVLCVRELRGDGYALPSLSPGSTRDGDGPYTVGECHVLSVERDIRIPDAVYNIAVADNHNYFAAGVLVHNCDVMMSVTDGHNTRLCINVPPGSGKSLLLNVFYPAWEWGPQNRPHLRYLSASYSTDVPERDNLRFARLIKHPVYQRCWGDRFKIIREGAGLVENDRTGSKRVTSTGGGTTGFRGDRLLCFPADQIVYTADGPVPIGVVVAARQPTRVWSTDVRTGRTSLKRVVQWHQNGPSDLLRVVLSDGSRVVCTPEHRLWTTSRGWVEARSLCASDVLPSHPAANEHDCFGRNAIARCLRPIRPWSLEYFQDLLRIKFGTVDALAVHSIDRQANAVGFFGPRYSGSNLRNRAGLNAVSGGNSLSVVGRLGNFSDLFSSQERVAPVLGGWERAVPLGVSNVLGARTIGEIIQAAIEWIAVKVADICAVRTGANKREHDDGVHKVSLNDSAEAGVETRIARGERGLEDALLDCVDTSLTRDAPLMAQDATKIGHAIGPLKAGDRTPVLVERFGHAAQTFCLTVEANHTFYCGTKKGLLVSNCDDLNNPRDVESDLVRKGTEQWVREIMPTRLNDLERSAIINLQQRTHEHDATGVIIENSSGWSFLCVPMEFDPLRIGTVPLKRDEGGEPTEVWTDPRALDENGDLLEGLTTNSRGEPCVEFGSPMAKAEGEVCWPERFTDDALATLKQISGAYAWSSQQNQIPGVRGGSIIKRDWWRLWQGDYPDLGTVIVSLDTAVEMAETNDYNACTAWGAFAGTSGEPLLLLLDGWRERLPLAQLVERVARTCRDRKADYLLIEHKTRGRDVADEMIRLYQTRTWETVLVKPQGDKVSRLKAVEHLFSGDARKDVTSGLLVMEGGIVYAPDRDWADVVISETAAFPYGAHDDYVDTVSQALGWVRKNGVILRKVEYDEAEAERIRYRKPTAVPYSIGNRR